MFKITKCKTKAAYTAKPLKNVTLNLKRIKAKFETTFESPIVLVLNVDGCEVIVHNHGELIFKKCKELKTLEEIAKKIYDEGILR